MKKIIFILVVLLIAIASARYTVQAINSNEPMLAAAALLLTVVFGAFFVQEVSAWQKERHIDLKR